MTIKGEVFVLSLGDPLWSPMAVLIPDFSLILTHLSKPSLLQKEEIFITVGGGAEARHYIKSGMEVLGQQLTSNDNDWLGIHATRLNAQLIRTIFQKSPTPESLNTMK